MTERTWYTYCGRIWLEVYHPGVGIEIYSFKNDAQLKTVALGLINLLQASALAGERYAFFRSEPDSLSAESAPTIACHV